MGFGFHTASAVLMLICLVFLILATISAPVVSSFALGQTTTHRFGVFGLCVIKTGSCTKAAYPYTVGDLDKGSGWTLAPSTRNTLSKIFILCPIGAGLSLIALIAILVGHFAGSAALIFALVINVIAFIVAILVCVIVIVVFNPNVAWTGWILIGLAVTALVSCILLVLAIKFHDSGDRDDDVDSTASGEKVFGTANAFEDKFSVPRTGTFNDDSSFKQSYQFTVQKPPTQISKTLTNSSVFNSNPQLAKDFTVHDKPSSNSLGRTGTATSSYYEEPGVNLVNGPANTVGQHQQMAPNVRPEVARTQIPGRSQPPYPALNPLDKRPYNPTDMSVFEHHPEVEGHHPFTELADDEPARTHNYHKSDEMDSDVESDFTSVSQRAPNPNYQPNMSYFPPQQQPAANYGNQQFQQPPPQGYPQAQYNQQFVPRPANNYGPPLPQVYGPPPQQSRGPTVSENILSQNPDFNFGRGARRGPQQFRPQGARGNPQRNMRGNRGGFRDSPYGGF